MYAATKEVEDSGSGAVSNSERGISDMGVSDSHPSKRREWSPSPMFIHLFFFTCERATASSNNNNNNNNLKWKAERETVFVMAG
jgi:hypothetical protein